MDLEGLLQHHRTIRVIGFDDGPFVRRMPGAVAIAGVVCAGTRFEGMLWSQIEADGWDSTAVLSNLVTRSKFWPQLHLVLLDGITMGGFNVVDLPLLAQQVQRPCVAVMRRQPDMAGMVDVLKQLPDPDQRLELIQRAGEIYAHPPFYFQVCGAAPNLVATALQRLTDRGHVPEALRVAHLITSAVIKGESGRQA